MKWTALGRHNNSHILSRKITAFRYISGLCPFGATLSLLEVANRRTVF
jgi:hypothetical protein